MKNTKIMINRNTPRLSFLWKGGLRLRLLPCATAIAALLSFQSHDAHAQTTAVPANDFLNSIGVNTHISQGYSEPSYEPMLNYTGIRNIRDGNIASPPTKYITLHTNTGVRIDICGSNLSGVISTGTALANVDALLSIEGPNEPNNFPIHYPVGGPQGGGFSLPNSWKLTSNVFSGTAPATAGVYAINMTAANANGTGHATVTVIVTGTAGSSVPAITNTVPAISGTIGQAISYTITASNSPTGYLALGLPPGLSVNTSSGAITGTPTQNGIATVTLGAINASGTGYAFLTITTGGTSTAPVVTSSPTKSVTVNGTFSYTIAATNSPTTYSATPSWVPVAQYQADLYASVHSNPALTGYPVLHVSEGGAEQNNVGMQWLTIPAGSGCIIPDGTQLADYANPHNYVCGNGTNHYVDNQAWNAADPAQNIAGVDGLYGEYDVTWSKGYHGYSGTTTPTITNLPRVTTETGWVTGTAAGQLTQDQQARMFMNVYLSAFARNWSSTFIYEMVDDQGGTGKWGFYSGTIPKTSGTYMHNFTTILSDTNSIASPGSLAISIPSQPATVHDLLLQKYDGTYSLVVWDEHPMGSGTDNVSVTLGGTFASVNVFDPTVGTTATQTLTNVSSVPLTLTDHPVIISIPAPVEAIVDNADSAHVTLTGVWTVSTSTPGYYATNYIHDGNTGTGKNVRFTPNLPSAGNYQVFAWWTAAGNRATNVPVSIISGTGTTPVVINETATGSQWVSLGTYPFNSGTNGAVVIANTGANGFVIADAVRFLKQ